MIYYTGNLFLGDESAIEKFSRPFNSVAEMDEAIINNWNSTVGKEETVVISGTFFSDNCKRPVRDYISMLNGNIVYIENTGEAPEWYRYEKIESIANYKYVDFGSKKVFLFSNGKPFYYYDCDENKEKRACIVSEPKYIISDSYGDDLSEEDELRLSIFKETSLGYIDKIISGDYFDTDNERFYCCATDKNKFKPVCL